MLDWALGTEFSSDDLGGEEIKLRVDGEQFYRFLATRLSIDPLVTRVLGFWDAVPMLVACVYSMHTLI